MRNDAPLVILSPQLQIDASLQRQVANIHSR